MMLTSNLAFPIFDKVIVDLRWGGWWGGVPETQINCLINDVGALACTTTLAIDHIKIHNTQREYKIQKYKVQSKKYKKY